MQEYPDYVMVGSQVVVYRFIEKGILLFKNVQHYVKTGRLELVCGMWIESDQNLPSVEAFSCSFF